MVSLTVWIVGQGVGWVDGWINKLLEANLLAWLVFLLDGSVGWLIGWYGGKLDGCKVAWLSQKHTDIHICISKDQYPDSSIC